MIKKGFVIVFVVVLFASCASSPVFMAQSYDDPRLAAQPGAGEAAVSGDSFYIDRHFQTETIPVGSTIAVIGAGNTGTTFMASSLLEKGLQVRQINLYGLLPMSDLQLTIPSTRFDYTTNLVGDASTIVAADAIDAGTEAETTDIDIDALIARLFNISDLTIEAERIDQYIALKEKLKELLDSLNIDYVMVVGSSYVEFDYQVSIYNTSNLNLVFTHTIVADIKEWRRVVGEPSQKENIAYSFTDEEEPVPFFELAYSEYLAGILDVQ